MTYIRVNITKPVKYKLGEQNKEGNPFCSVLSTDDLIEYGKNFKFPNGIPKIVHYVYRTAFIPTQYSPHVKQCMEINKHMKFVFWTDFSSYRFIIEHFSNYLNVYSSFFSKSSEALKISDVIRYFILLKFGGIYMDLDTKCQKLFNFTSANDSCVLSKEMEEQSQILWNVEYLAMNSLMICVPEHDFFKYVVQRLSKSDSSGVVEQTGPMMLTKVLWIYNKTLNSTDLQNPQKSIVVADSYMYSPLSKDYLESRCKYIPIGKWKIKGCRNLAEHRKKQKMKTPEAVAVHLFMHLGYAASKAQIKNIDNICYVNSSFVVW